MVHLKSIQGCGVYSNGYYRTGFTIANTTPTVDYQQASQDSDPQLQDFLSAISSQEQDGIGDMFSNKYLGQLQYTGAEPGVEVLGKINELQEKYKQNMMEQDAVEFPSNLAGFGLLDHVLVPYYDANGHLVYNNGQPTYMLRGRYGYKLLSKKPQYHSKMYPVAQTIWQNSINERMHLGNFKRHLINTKIYSDSLEMHIFSPYRLAGGYPSPLSSWAKSHLGMGYYPLHYMVGTPFEIIKGLVLGPRIDIVTKKPVTINEAKKLFSILSAGNAQARLEAEENT
jgi:hypothetical protein